MEMPEWAFWVLLILGGYLLGSMHFCRWIPLLFLKKDIVALSEDGNPGAVNVFRHCGVGWGLLCLLFDLAKGFLPVFCAVQLLDCQSPWFALVLAAPVLGHGFSVFARFRGGKCIAASFGELAALLWISPVFWVLAFLYIVFSLARINPRRFRSMLTFSIFLPIAAGVEIALGQFSAAAGCVLISLTALYKHWVSKEEEALPAEQAGQQ